MTDELPLCPCHGVPMEFMKRGTSRPGGYVCHVKRKANKLRDYYRHREARIAAVAAYQATPRAQARMRTWQFNREVRAREARIRQIEEELKYGLFA